MKYPISDHPFWDTLISYLGAYGYTMDANGWWHWDQTQSAKAMSVKDVTDSITLAKMNPDIFAQYFAPGRDTPMIMQRLTAARLTVHLREAVLYLQFQSYGANLPALEDHPTITETPLGYPVIRLKKHQEDALFNEFEQDDLFSLRQNLPSATRSRSHREIWEADRKLGIVPHLKWKTGAYYWGMP